MRARRSPGGTEALVCCIYGLNRRGDVMRIWAYRKGQSVKLSSGDGRPHFVHASNESNVEGWVREAALVWSLTDTFDIPVHLRNTDHERTEVDRITAKGQKWKEQSAANAQGILDGGGHDKPE
jgi:hypothetical protein